MGAVHYKVPQAWHDDYAKRKTDLEERAKNGDKDAAWRLYLASEECTQDLAAMREEMGDVE